MTHPIDPHADLILETISKALSKSHRLGTNHSLTAPDLWGECYIHLRSHWPRYRCGSSLPEWIRRKVSKHVSQTLLHSERGFRRTSKRIPGRKHPLPVWVPARELPFSQLSEDHGETTPLIERFAA